MKKTIKFLAAAAMAVVSISQVSAQSYSSGADCGCPPISQRQTVNVTTLLNNNDEFGTPGTTIALDQVFTCDKIYILNKKSYVDSTKTLTIQPGTIIKGAPSPTGLPVDATALVVERGAKIFAQGTASCPIVFTALADNLDGTYAYTNRGQWGGVVILGNATNNHNLTTSAPAFGGTCTNPTGCNGTGIGRGFIEGFVAADARNQYGGGTTPNDDDNSGILTYVSIRHAGALLSAGNELNGLSLGSVGRGTKIENIEIVSNDDDGIEFFGGTVNVKYASVLYCNDDAIDWDNGYRGKLQFIFAVYGNSTDFPATDNGFEMDADDRNSNNPPFSAPIVYNATVIGNGENTGTASLGSDNSAHAALNFKDGTGGEIYNSVFANFRNAINFRSLPETGSTVEAYERWTGGVLKVNCNVFTEMDSNVVKNASLANGNGNSTTYTADLAKLIADSNQFVSSIPGFDPFFTLSGNTVVNRYDAIPTPNLTLQAGCPVATNDSFFTPAYYKGAFSNNERTWLTDWAYGLAIASEQSFGGCPTDIDGSGVTNNSDFLILLGKFNQSCN